MPPARAVGEAHTPDRAPAARRTPAAPRPARLETHGAPAQRAGLYVDGSLTPGESVVHVGSLHWIIYVPGAFVLMLGLFLVSSSGAASGIGGWIAGLGVVLLIRAALLQYSTELALTTKRVVAKVGLIRRSTIDLNHAKVESYSVEQSVVGRLLDYGTVIVRGTGGAHTPIAGVAHPLRFRREAAILADAAPK